MKHKIAKIVGWVILGICAAAALVFLFGLFVQMLWNWLMPAVFGLNQITYWQAIGILVLSHILFKTHMPGHSHGKQDGTRCGPISRLRARFSSSIHEEPSEEQAGSESNA